MDLLSQYKQQNPEAFQEKKPLPLTDEYGRTYSGMVAFVIRLSGGRIRDARQASYALLGVVAFIIIISLSLFFYGGRNTIYVSKELIPVQQPLPNAK